MPKFSIITPCYNSFELMSRYFESFINQSYNDFELIIVDDCSTDGSYEKLKEYAKESQKLNIKVTRTDDNSGPGNARNKGIEIAESEWITFVDNDDWVSVDLLAKVNKIIEEYNVNCVIYDYYLKTDKNEQHMKSMYCGETGIIQLTECMKYVRNHSVGKFYKLKSVKDIRYPNLRRCEDVAYVCQAIEACQLSYYLSEPLYYYYQRKTSLSNKTTIDESDMLQAFGILEKLFLDKYPREIKEKSVTDLLYGVLLMKCKARRNRSEVIEYINSYETKYSEWYECDIINHLGLVKKMFLMSAKKRLYLPMRLYAFVHTVFLQ